MNVLSPFQKLMLHLFQQLQELKQALLLHVLTKFLQILTLDNDEGW